MGKQIPNDILIFYMSIYNFTANDFYDSGLNHDKKKKKCQKIKN